MPKSTNIEFIQGWINRASIYPPAEIFFQAPKSQEKKEKRCKQICESLYRFNWEDAQIANPIANVREVVREMVVIDRMFEYSRLPPDYQYVVKMVAKFLKSAYYLIEQLDSMHKEHDKLNTWYGHWRKGPLHIMMNANRWGADILRLPGEDKVQIQYLDDIAKEMEDTKWR